MDAEAAVLTRVASGDERAVEECLRRYGGLVWSIARRLIRDAGEAEDAVQEIFVELWRVADRFDPAKASEATFVATVSRRRLIDRRRRLARQPGFDELPESGPQEPSINPAAGGLEGLGLSVASAFRELRQEQRRVLQLQLGLGMTHGEIVEKTGMPLGTVKTHARRGLIRLREILGSPAGAPGRGGA